MRPLSKIPDALYQRLQGLSFHIRKDFDYFPCRATLTDGRVLDRLYIFKPGRHFLYPPHSQETDLTGYTWHYSNRELGDHVFLEEIAAIEPSPLALSREIVGKIIALSPHREHDYRCTLVLKDGRHVPYAARFLVDFPDLPPGVAGSDVVDALPDEARTPSSRIRGPAPHRYTYFEEPRERFGRDPGVHRSLLLTPALWEELRRIEPAVGDYRPCRMTLKNGRVLDHVYAFSAERSFIYPDRNYVWMKEVAKIEESPDRLPKPFADKMNAAGESGMGYCLFALDFRDGRRLYVSTGNFIDLLVLPEGYAFDQIVGIVPHARHQGPTLGGPELRFCPYLGGG
jgi:hypothetical protein